MRGELQITASKAPFRRAGLAFHAGAATIVHLGDLDGHRLHVLLTEPRLTVLADRGDGFMPFPPLDDLPADREETVKALQQLIDRYAEDRPVPAVPEPTDVGALQARVAELLAELGDAREVLTAMDAKVTQIEGERDAAITELAELKAKAADQADPKSEVKPAAPAKKTAPQTK